LSYEDNDFEEGKTVAEASADERSSCAVGNEVHRSPKRSNALNLFMLFLLGDVDNKFRFDIKKTNPQGA
jgi:hypothetical protein